MLCDDGTPLAMSCGVILPQVEPATLSYVMCGTGDALFALQNGCYVCVDASTCVPLRLPSKLRTEAHELPKANGNDISVLLQDQADVSPDDTAYEQVAAVAEAKLAGAGAQPEEPSKSTAALRQVSDWWFLAPGLLAVVALGMAINNRVSARRRGFQRLHDTNRQDQSSLFQENINPFCLSTIDENMAIETAGHFQGDPSMSESEDAQFLPSTELEDDEVTEAEAEAIKRAVLLHIKEFDEEEDDEEVEI
ncbi:unnamed protein product [Phytophthora fragariaefolia]|uniref:Unnamed protein product n=1 Tax=Phytophthora fragariaefolia TaxID=1490495 RepID=A0A9W6UA32_9STRA|nr:unnamed protein product [Phytophthora fragariaefolia]